MAGERARQMRKAGEEALTEALRQAEETGELRHLYGQPLDLSDDSPDWFVHKLLKEEGASLPLIERGKDLDRMQREAAATVERLRRRRAWLVSREARCTPEMARRFNEARADALEQYRAALSALNRAILAYNLAAPAPLHRRGIVVADALERVSGEVPPLDTAALPAAPVPASPGDSSRLRALHRGPVGLRMLWRRMRGARSDASGSAETRP